MKVLRYLFLFFSFSLPAGAADLTSAVYALADRPVLQGTSWAAAAAYTDGTPLFAVHSSLRLAPASTLKLLTSAAALETFGPFHRFETQIYSDALPDENGILHGNLYIRGGGDPTLGSARVTTSPDWPQLLEEWSQKISRAGIKQITGNIYGDISLFSGPSLPDKFNWQNIGNYFAAPATALAFNDNAFEITFFPQPQDSAPMAVKSFLPETEGLHIHSFVTASEKDRRDNAYVYAAPGEYEIEIYGTLPTSTHKPMTIRAALPNAPQLLVDLLQQQLAKDGVKVNGKGILLKKTPDYAALHMLFTHSSPPLKDIVYVLNKNSFNFYAEMLLRMLAVQAGKTGSVEEGIAQLYTFLNKNGIDTQNLLLYDGSGLSRDNQITAQTLLDILSFMAKSPHFSYYCQSLATEEERKDLLPLRRLLRSQNRNGEIHLKSGTIDGVKAWAGYVKNRNGRLVAFAFLANNLPEKNADINRFYEDLIKLLLKQPDK